jgi:hypothetical protein
MSGGATLKSMKMPIALTKQLTTHITITDET